MRVQLFVISDLHLGGEPGLDGAPGFQMCPVANQQRLTAFINGLPKAGPREEVRLVLAGDVVDFLAEKEFAVFTGDQNAANQKLQRILQRTRPVWDALATFVQSGGHLTVLLGNHDVELCLPAVRRHFLKTLGEARVEFLYDNEAFTLGPVLIEHGNRYDGWNAVPHGRLRRFRSELTRGIRAVGAPSMPGSYLVVEVMNDLKSEYSWVDLLKPETSASLPILAALGAANLGRVWKAFRKYQQSRAVDYAANGEPADAEYIAAGVADGGVPQRDQEMWDLAQRIAGGGSVEEIGAVQDALAGARSAVSGGVRSLRRAALREALPLMAKQRQITFDTGHEDDAYFTAAMAAADRGFEVIVYGHTHLPKSIEFTTKHGHRARYLNTGTWADLMRMPDSVFMRADNGAGPTLDDFVADLEKDEVHRWRRSAPTFAQIVLEDETVVSADLRFADAGTGESVTTEGLMKRLSAM